MSTITKKLKEKFQPFVALIAYRSNVDGSFYMESRDIKNGEMQNSKPLTIDCVSKLLKSIAKFKCEVDDENIYGRIPSNVLWYDSRFGKFTLIWYREPEIRRHYFSKGLGLPDGEIKIPGLLYIVRDKSLSMYAFKGTKPKNKLYHAPFMNVNNGSVCLGTAKVKKSPEQTFESVMKHWEDKFWLSEFSHIYGANPVKGNLSSIIKQCIATGEPFPIDNLIPANTNLKSILV